MTTPNNGLVLGEHGYRPGLAVADLYRGERREGRFWKLLTCGVEPRVGRGVVRRKACAGSNTGPCFRMDNLGGDRVFWRVVLDQVKMPYKDRDGIEGRIGEHAQVGDIALQGFQR